MKLKKMFIVLLASCFVFLGKQLPASAEFIQYLGDANQDYCITAEDALSVLKHVVGKKTLPEEIRGYCDVDSSGHISAEDALLVLKKVVNSIKYFPAANSPEDVYGVFSEWLEAMEIEWYETPKKPLPKKFMLDKRVELKQQGVNQCWAFASSYIFQFLGEDVSGEKIFEDCPMKNEDGTLEFWRLTEYLNNRKGYNAKLYMGTREALLDALCKGTPVIIFCRAAKGYTDVYHYMDLTGYDENYLYFADPLKSTQIGNLYNYVLYYSELEELWDTGYPEYSHLFIVLEKEASADK